MHRRVSAPTRVGEVLFIIHTNDADTLSWALREVEITVVKAAALPLSYGVVEQTRAAASAEEMLALDVAPVLAPFPAHHRADERVHRADHFMHAPGQNAHRKMGVRCAAQLTKMKSLA